MPNYPHIIPFTPSYLEHCHLIRHIQISGIVLEGKNTCVISHMECMIKTSSGENFKVTFSAQGQFISAYHMQS